MDKNYQALFEKYEHGTNHKKLLKMTEYIAKTGWLVVLIAIAIIYYNRAEPIGFYILVFALFLLVVSLLLGIKADHIRKGIQDKIDATHD